MWLDTLFPMRMAASSSYIASALHADFVKTDNLMMKFVWFHLAVVSTVTAIPTSSFMLGIVGGSLLAAICFLAVKNNPGALLTRITFGIAFMGYSAIMIQQMGGRIEAHFHVLAMLPLLLVYKDMWPVLAAATVIGIHHIVFTSMQQAEATILGTPVVIFSYNCGINTVLLHMTYAIVDVALVGIIMFKDNTEFLKRIDVQQELDTLMHGADTTANMSHELANASQQSADGATVQADSISTIEMSVNSLNDIIHSSSDKASQTSTKANQSKVVMDRLNGAMGTLIESGKQITHILKSIDAIAFQTNLLALNASVEAARAGEAGAGFSVVADEVRQLALRTSEASRQITGLISENTKSIDEAQNSVKTVEDVFVDFQGMSADIASELQSFQVQTNSLRSSIEQISSVTSQSVAAAEETSSVSSELKSQAETFKHAIDSLKLKITDHV